LSVAVILSSVVVGCAAKSSPEVKAGVEPQVQRVFPGLTTAEQDALPDEAFQVLPRGADVKISYLPDAVVYSYSRHISNPRYDRYQKENETYDKDGNTYGPPISIKGENRLDVISSNCVVLRSRSQVCQPDTNNCHVINEAEVVHLRKQPITRPLPVDASYFAIGARYRLGLGHAMLKVTAQRLHVVVLLAKKLSSTDPAPGQCEVKVSGRASVEENRREYRNTADTLERHGYVSYHSVAEAVDTLEHYELARNGCYDSQPKMSQMFIQNGKALLAKINGS